MQYIVIFSGLVTIFVGLTTIYQFIKNIQHPVTQRPGLILGVITVILMVFTVLLANSPLSRGECAPTPTLGSNPLRVTTTAKQQIPSPTPTLISIPSTPTPAPTATSPAPNTVLYNEDGADNWKDWSLSADWRKVSNGILISNGGGPTPSAIAPISTSGLTNFEVEASIRVPPNQGSSWWEFGVTVCGSTQADNKWAGYKGYVWQDYSPRNVTIGRDGNNGAGIDTAGYDPGTDWHTYRLETRGNDLKFLIDGAAVVHATDDQFLTCGGQIGFYDGGGVGIEVQVRSFKVTAL